MRLETLARNMEADVVPLSVSRDAFSVWRTDWAPLLSMLTDDARPAAERAAIFHLSLAHALLEQAFILRATTGISAVGLTGGVFQNRLLTETVIPLLENAGFSAHLPQQLPINDAGLSVGQVIEFLNQAPS